MRPEVSLPDLSRLTLLAVDDNADALDVLGAILKACGAQVLEARGAQDALAYVDATPWLDAIITDLSMPAWTASSWRAGCGSIHHARGCR